jgi:SAM-dependent methyltransferase
MRQRLRNLLLPIYKPSRSKLLVPYWRDLMMRPAIFEIWFRARLAWFWGIRHGLKALGASPDGQQTFVEKVKSYNQSKIFEFFRIRTEKFMVLLRCIDGIPRDAKVLCIGPRNEAEILLLSLYGYPLRNITGVDLFTYSPLIRAMDMHNLDFPDDSFDIVYSAWTLKYSFDLPRACSEIVRVAKPSGVVVTGFSHTSEITAEVGSPMARGLDELLNSFSPHVGWVFWQEVAPTGKDGVSEVSVIFRVRKDATPGPQPLR